MALLPNLHNEANMNDDVENDGVSSEHFAVDSAGCYVGRSVYEITGILLDELMLPDDALYSDELSLKAEIELAKDLTIGPRDERLYLLTFCQVCRNVKFRQILENDDEHHTDVG